MSDEKQAKLVGMEMRDVMSIRLAALEFKDDGVVRVGGDNGAGKSSLLKGLLWALGGAKALDKNDEPLRRGADRGYVEVELGGVGFQVRRSVTEKGMTLTVKDSEGKAVARPQEVLDRLLGQVGIDPSTFLTLPPDKQAQALREQCGLTFDDLDEQQKVVYEQRTQVNRRVSELKARLNAQESFPDAPTEEMSSADIVEELDRARTVNGENQKKRDALGRLRQTVADMNERIERLKTEMAEAEAAKAKAVADGKALRVEVDKLVDVDERAVTEKLRTLDVNNQKARANAAHAKLEREFKETEKQSSDMTSELERLAGERASRVAAAQIPVSGLGFGEDGMLTLHGAPLVTASDGEKVKAAFDLAVAARPDLRLVVLRHGAMLDEKNRRLIAKLAMERNYLVLMEVVGDEDGRVEVLVENGQVTQKG